MDKSLLLYRGGVRSVKKTLSDGNEHTLYYKAKTPNELAEYFGAEAAIGEAEKATPSDSPKLSVQRQKHRARFIASSLCEENGELMFANAVEAENVPATLKGEIITFIISGSNESGNAGKD